VVTVEVLESHAVAAIKRRLIAKPTFMSLLHHGRPSGSAPRIAEILGFKKGVRMVFG
jgi:hypothetical protein